MEDHDPARPDVFGQATEKRGRVWLELEHVPPDDRIERALERESAAQVALYEAGVRDPSLLRPAAGHLDRLAGVVDADNRPGVADEPGDEERDVACAGPHVEDP